MNKLKQIIYILGLSFIMVFSDCSDPDDEVKSINYDRLFSPTDFKLQISNRTNIIVLWNAVKNADSYTLELFENGDLNFEGTPLQTIDGISRNGTLTNPYIISGMDGETSYSIRLKAISASIPDSKWAEGTIKTATEQIFQSLDPEELEATEVILRWTPGEEVTELILEELDSDNNVVEEVIYTITSAQIAAGTIKITELTAETTYTATLKNGTKTRGTLTFTTMIDLGDAVAINEGDDIIAILDAAEDGDSFVIISGEFDLDGYNLTKALSLSGYKVTDKPTLRGNFNFQGNIGSLTLRNLILDGQSTQSYPITAASTAIVGDVTVTSCDILNYKSGVIYNNSGASYGNVSISDCIITDITGSGGDGFDFRAGGTLASLTVENCTFNTGFRAFLRMQISSNVIFRNCTFYKISTPDDSNNTGLFRITGGTLEVTNCLFVETGPGTDSPTNSGAGNWCRNSANMGATANYNNNMYYSCYNLWAGLYTNPSQCSASEADPQFVDPENGDFTVQSIVVNVGDPRWLP